MAIETIDGHQYLVIRDTNGNIVSQAGCDVVPAPPVQLSKFQFRSLFTLAERVAIDNGVPASGTLTADQLAQLKTLSLDFQIADSIDLMNPLTVEGVNFLEACALIAAGRAAQVLAKQTPN